MAHGERNHIWPDAGCVDIDGRVGLGIRLLFLDFIYNGPWGRHSQRGRDFYACGHDRLQHGGGFCRCGGKQSDSDGNGVADGERNHIWPDAGCIDTERWHGVGRRDLLLDDSDNGAINGDKQPGRDVYRDGRS
jgi:hypothetical protein